ncbi:MAG: hypothetical protein KC427_02105 [Sulfurovum sp.]|uniref:hypothetical protein n=1 Tax=Sulfurovum sp. TaxID=1969726 RepID=UPI0028680044|nr:hypothetical protein [Sulfurovum sp.]MCO4844790.1 hypothetical protein [Sulfurovum sp.]
MKKLLILLGALALTFTLATAEGKCGKCDSSKKIEKKCDSGKCDSSKKAEKKCDNGKCDSDKKAEKCSANKDTKKEAPAKGKCGKGKCGE